MNSHARFAAHTARALGYAFRSLDGDDAYLFEVSDGTRKAAFPIGYATPYGLNDARAYSLARDKAFSQRVLDEAGLQTIPSILFFANDRQAAYRSPGRELNDALRWSVEAASEFPVFCKPNQGSKGEFAEIAADPSAFADYMHRVGAHYDVILVQPLLEGEEYRVLVLEDRALCVYRKGQPQLIGDGESSVRQLLEAARATWKQPKHAAPLDAARVRTPDGVQIALDTVIEHGAMVTLDGRANRSAGGSAYALTEEVPEELARFALDAARTLGLQLAGVDLFDLSPTRDLSDLVVIEVNANPAIETLEAHERYDLIEAIWSANFRAALK